MTVVGIVLIALGIACTVIGTMRFATLQRSARALETQEANIRRYESWRGRRPGADRGPSSAELMARELRRRAYLWLVLDAAGTALIIAGILVI